MLTDDVFNRVKEEPNLALVYAVDQLGEVGEAMNGLIDLILDKGTGDYVRFRRQGMAQLLDPLFEQLTRAHSLVDHARKKLYPPRSA